YRTKMIILLILGHLMGNFNFPLDQQVSILFHCLIYPNKQKQVFQSPTQLLGKPNIQINLTLTHNISSYDTILWYHRSAGDTSMKLVAYVNYKTLKVEPGFESRFSVSGDGEKTGHLHILNPKHPEDSGEYFGAANSTQNRGHSSYQDQTKQLLVKSERETVPVQSSNQSNSTCQPAYCIHLIPNS
uniref:Immunoglobulin V-set domain-containing protein n=1 Tax=Haplochromis burtoni TaxID=8153 RepID=A0A3Q2X0G6_HAPBU